MIITENEILFLIWGILLGMIISTFWLVNYCVPESPLKKTRYFLWDGKDDETILGKWKYSQNRTEFFDSELGVWSSSTVYKLKHLKQFGLEIDALSAYRIFPHAFPKKQKQSQDNYN
jgi:hypothetical protein